MKKIDLTWMTQISFGSTIIFPNSVVIKISPCWGTREENRTKRKENLRENKDWGLSYHCSCDRRQWKHQQPFSSPIRKSPSELLKHLEREKKKKTESTWKWASKRNQGFCSRLICENASVCYVMGHICTQIRTHLSTMEVLQVYMWMPMPLRDLASPAPQTVCRPCNIQNPNQQTENL